MWYLHAMRHHVDFEGRASRIEFWEFLGGWLLLTMMAVAIDDVRAGPYGLHDHLVAYAVAGVHVVPYCAVAVRRSHDLDRSGWLALLGFVPFVDFGMLLVWAFPGTAGPNRFGPAPGHRPDGSPLPAHPSTTRAWEPCIDRAAAMPLRPTIKPALVRQDPLATVAEIERLAELLYAGALSDAEFEALKERLILGEPA